MSSRPFPVAVVAAPPDEGCAGGEVFALQVLGESMRPEFDPGDVVVIEPDGRVHEGAFVLARWQGEWMLRRLGRGPAGWVLQTLNPAAGEPLDAELPLADLSAIRGVVIQKSRPGRRRATRRYVE